MASMAVSLCSTLISAHVTLPVKAKDSSCFSSCENNMTDFLVFFCWNLTVTLWPQAELGLEEVGAAGPIRGCRMLFSLSLWEAWTFCFALKSLACTFGSRIPFLFNVRVTFLSESKSQYNNAYFGSIHSFSNSGFNSFPMSRRFPFLIVCVRIPAVEGIHCFPNTAFVGSIVFFHWATPVLYFLVLIWNSWQSSPWSINLPFPLFYLFILYHTHNLCIHLWCVWCRNCWHVDKVIMNKSHQSVWLSG